MIQHMYIDKEDSFLPAVKARLVQHTKNRKELGKKSKSVQDKISIIKSKEDAKDMNEIMQNYYRKLRIQTHKNLSLLVNINFKSIEKEQHQKLNSKDKKQKARVHPFSNKARFYSEDANKNKLNKRSLSENDRSSSSNQSILRRIRMMHNFFTKVRREELKSNLFNFQDITSSDKLQKPKISKKEQFNDSPSLSLKRKNRNQQKILKKLRGSCKIQKILTPWINQSMRADNEQQTIQLLKKSIELL